MNENSYFLRHEPCSNCGSRDNLAVWSDGHKYCFGCGYIESGNGESLAVKLDKALKQHRKDKEEDLLVLPDDVSFNLPSEVSEWLNKYYITKEQIAQYNLRWSEKQKSLILPIYEDGKLIFYQERNFVGKSPKYLTYGNLNGHLPVFGGDADLSIVVLVEDYISAIRVSREAPCMPLFGSSVNKTIMARLAYAYSYLAFWLDHDKYSEAIKFKKKYGYLFDFSTIIHTHKDPKEYTDDDIFEHVWGNFDLDVETA